MTFRDLLALWACKLSRSLLRLLNRGGTSLPGKLALRLSPALLGKLTDGVTVFAVSGTNGKTTCCRMLTQAFADAGIGCIANRSGANLLAGITAEFAGAADLLGRARAKYAVIECDEAAARHVYPLLRPHSILLTNIFRDQLDRYGEVTHTLSELREAIALVPEALLICNADDSLLRSLPETLQNPVRFYGVDCALTDGNDPVNDAVFCLRCGASYQYSRRTYGHLGSYFCPECGYARPAPDFSVTEAAHTASGYDFTLTHRGEALALHVPLKGAYSVYNAAAAASALLSAGIFPDDAVRRAIGGTSSGFGRQERFDLGRGIEVILVKNPVGLTQVLSLLSERTEPFALALCLNDNSADGTDISWIWDADFERLAGKNRPARLYLSGTRAEELLIRLKYAGLPVADAVTERDPAALTELLCREELPCVVLPTYTALMELRPRLAAKAGKNAFWE